MRHECEVLDSCRGFPITFAAPTEETCGRPAIDFITLTDGRHLYVCAEHYDILMNGVEACSNADRLAPGLPVDVEWESTDESTS
jgi:hypothetical protein